MTESRFVEGEMRADRDAGVAVRSLPAGYRLGEFELDSVLEVGGFGIVYRAFDRTRQRPVAVKEYMPAMLAQRADDDTVGLRAQRYASAFEAGRAAFLDEARLLAQFDHPGLLKVLHFGESHGTAYRVMPFYEGQTLAQRSRQAGPMSEPELLYLLASLLGALHTLHCAQCFHRDISLDNILLQPDGQPVLLGFGATHKLSGDLVDETTMIVRPGYAPIEQYADDPAFKQGPWTDIYALGAAAYALITGALPPAAVVRGIQDRYRPLAGRQWPDGGMHYSERLSSAIDAALGVRVDDRPASVSVFAERLGLRETMAGMFLVPDRARAVPPPVASAVSSAPAAEGEAESKPAPTSTSISIPISAAAARSTLIVGAADSKAGANGDATIDDVTSDASAEPKAAPRADDPPATAIPEAAPLPGSVGARTGTPRRGWGVRRFAVPAMVLLIVVAGGFTFLRSGMRTSEPAASAPPAQTAAQLAARQPVQARSASAATGIASAPVATSSTEPDTANASTPSSDAGANAPASAVALASTSAPSSAPVANAPASDVSFADASASSSATVANTPASAVSLANASAPSSPAASPAASGIESAGTAATVAAPIGGSSSTAAIAAQQPAVHGEAASAAGSSARRSTAAATTTRNKALRPVLVRFFVSPWGEVYIDGIKRGTSPPFRTINLTPGTYRVEIRNGTLPPFNRVMTFDIGKSPVDISYAFQ